MEGIENQQTTEITQPETPEVVDQNPTEPTEVTAETQEVIQPEINEDEIAISYLKKQGFEIETADDLQRYKQPQVKEVNPYEDLMDEEDRMYFEFKKNTGKSKKEFEMLRIDPESITPLEYAIEKARKESGLNLTKEEALEFLEDELGIADFDELSNTDRVKLARYSKDLKEERANMYNELKDLSTKQTAPKNQPETIKLEDGRVVNKADYEQFQVQRQQYLNTNKEAVNSVANSEFKVMLDDNGEQREVSFSYEYNDQDKHSMLSLTNDTSKTFQRYQTENGLNHKQFNEDMWWTDPANRNKAIASIIQKALATNTEELLKGRGNVNLTNEPLPAQKTEGVKMVPINDIFKSF